MSPEEQAALAESRKLVELFERSRRVAGLWRIMAEIIPPRPLLGDLEELNELARTMLDGPTD